MFKQGANELRWVELVKPLVEEVIPTPTASRLKNVFVEVFFLGSKKSKSSRYISNIKRGIKLAEELYRMYSPSVEKQN